MCAYVCVMSLRLQVAPPRLIQLLCFVSSVAGCVAINMFDSLLLSCDNNTLCLCGATTLKSSCEAHYFYAGVIVLVLP